MRIRVRIRIVPKNIASHLEQKFPAKAIRRLHSTFRQLANEVAVDARGRAPVATGSLRDSIKVVQDRQTGSAYTVRWQVQAAGDERRYRFSRKGRLYGLYVHTGGRPHMPPLQPIMSWLEVVRPELRREPAELRSAAYHVAGAIATRGTPMRQFLAEPFLEKVLDKEHLWASQLLESTIKSMQP